MNPIVTSLMTHLPLLIVYGFGLRMARARSTEQAGPARLASWAFGLLLSELIVGELLTTWLFAMLNAQTMNGAQGNGEWQLFLLNALGIVRMLVHTLAIYLLIRALFPILPGAAPAHWLRRVLGLGIGLMIGALLGMALGDPIGAALGISNFEGERGYFVVFLLIPGFALLGALGGALIVGFGGRK